jgi:hypothetical protein
MKELEEYRRRLVERLEGAAQDFRATCLAVPDPQAPIEADGWNAHQLAAHTRDVEALVYGLRARRTAQEDNPVFQNFDGDAYMAEHYNPQEPLGPMLEGFAGSVAGLAQFLRGLPTAAWARESSHATNGSGFTLQTWVERGLGHIEEHLETLRKAQSAAGNDR